MTATATYYSRPIRMPRTKREGLANFVQMIVNALEAGDTREALLKAVDLHDDIVTGMYDDAMVDAKAAQSAARELEAKHAAEIIAAAERGREEGIAAEKRRMAKALELLNA